MGCFLRGIGGISNILVVYDLEVKGYNKFSVYYELVY